MVSVLKYVIYENQRNSLYICVFLKLLNILYFQTIFDPFYISVYNMFYTALPILAIGALDQDVNEYKSIMYPKLYTPGLRNMFFNTKEFFKCVILGTYASLVIFFVPYGIVWSSIIVKSLNIVTFDKLWIYFRCIFIWHDFERIKRFGSHVHGRSRRHDSSHSHDDTST